LSSVDAFAGDDITHTARWFYDVAFAPWDQVEVAMEDGLPSDLPVVHADVEAFHARIRLLDRLLLLF
jgi:hypothetical protein